MDSNNTIKLSLRKGGNKFLTVVFSDLGFHGKELLQLNSFRLLFRAMTLTEVVRGDILYVRGKSRRFNAPAEYSQYLWPKERSGSSHKIIWVSVLDSLNI